MLTGEIRNQVDAIWNAFWTGGISNPLEVIEQITYLLFLRRLDELQAVEAARLKQQVERAIFPKGKDPKGRPYNELRWSRFKNAEARAMFDTVTALLGSGKPRSLPIALANTSPEGGGRGSAKVPDYNDYVAAAVRTIV
jgi:HsdM N-terminal domain